MSGSDECQSEGHQCRVTESNDSDNETSSCATETLKTASNLSLCEKSNTQNTSAVDIHPLLPISAKNCSQNRVTSGSVSADSTLSSNPDSDMASDLVFDDDSAQNYSHINKSGMIVNGISKGMEGDQLSKSLQNIHGDNDLRNPVVLDTQCSNSGSSVRSRSLGNSDSNASEAENLSEYSSKANETIIKFSKLRNSDDSDQELVNSVSCSVRCPHSDSGDESRLNSDISGSQSDINSTSENVKENEPSKIVTSENLDESSRSVSNSVQDTKTDDSLSKIAKILEDAIEDDVIPEIAKSDNKTTSDVTRFNECNLSSDSSIHSMSGKNNEDSLRNISLISEESIHYIGVSKDRLPATSCDNKPVLADLVCDNLDSDDDNDNSLHDIAQIAEEVVEDNMIFEIHDPSVDQEHYGSHDKVSRDVKIIDTVDDHNMDNTSRDFKESILLMTNGLPSSPVAGENSVNNIMKCMNTGNTYTGLGGFNEIHNSKASRASLSGCRSHVDENICILVSTTDSIHDPAKSHSAISVSSEEVCVLRRPSPATNKNTINVDDGPEQVIDCDDGDDDSLNNISMPTDDRPTNSLYEQNRDPVISVTCTESFSCSKSESGDESLRCTKVEFKHNVVDTNNGNFTETVDIASSHTSNSRDKVVPPEQSQVLSEDSKIKDNKSSNNKMINLLSRSISQSGALIPNKQQATRNIDICIPVHITDPDIRLNVNVSLINVARGGDGASRVESINLDTKRDIRSISIATVTSTSPINTPTSNAKHNVDDMHVIPVSVNQVPCSQTSQLAGNNGMRLQAECSKQETDNPTKPKNEIVCSNIETPPVITITSIDSCSSNITSEHEKERVSNDNLAPPVSESVSRHGQGNFLHPLSREVSLVDNSSLSENESGFCDDNDLNPLHSLSMHRISRSISRSMSRSSDNIPPDSCRFGNSSHNAYSDVTSYRHRESSEGVVQQNSSMGSVQSRSLPPLKIEGNCSQTNVVNLAANESPNVSLVQNEILKSENEITIVSVSDVNAFLKSHDNSDRSLIPSNVKANGQSTTLCNISLPVPDNGTPFTLKSDTSLSSESKPMDKLTTGNDNCSNSGSISNKSGRSSCTNEYSRSGSVVAKHCSKFPSGIYIDIADSYKPYLDSVGTSAAIPLSSNAHQVDNNGGDIVVNHSDDVSTKPSHVASYNDGVMPPCHVHSDDGVLQPSQIVCSDATVREPSQIVCSDAILLEHTQIVCSDSTALESSEIVCSDATVLEHTQIVYSNDVCLEPQHISSACDSVVEPPQIVHSDDIILRSPSIVCSDITITEPTHIGSECIKVSGSSATAPSPLDTRTWNGTEFSLDKSLDDFVAAPLDVKTDVNAEQRIQSDRDDLIYNSSDDSITAPPDLPTVGSSPSKTCTADISEASDDDIEVVSVYRPIEHPDLPRMISPDDTANSESIFFSGEQFPVSDTDTTLPKPMILVRNIFCGEATDGNDTSEFVTALETQYTAVDEGDHEDKDSLMVFQLPECFPATEKGAVMKKVTSQMHVPTEMCVEDFAQPGHQDKSFEKISDVEDDIVVEDNDDDDDDVVEDNDDVENNDDIVGDDLVDDYVVIEDDIDDVIVDDDDVLQLLSESRMQENSETIDSDCSDICVDDNLSDRIIGSEDVELTDLVQAGMDYVNMLLGSTQNTSITSQSLDSGTNIVTPIAEPVEDEEDQSTAHIFTYSKRKVHRNQCLDLDATVNAVNTDYSSSSAEQDSVHKDNDKDDSILISDVDDEFETSEGSEQDDTSSSISIEVPTGRKRFVTVRNGGKGRQFNLETENSPHPNIFKASWVNLARKFSLEEEKVQLELINSSLYGSKKESDASKLDLQRRAENPLWSNNNVVPINGKTPYICLKRLSVSEIADMCRSSQSSSHAYHLGTRNRTLRKSIAALSRNKESVTSSGDESSKSRTLLQVNLARDTANVCVSPPKTNIEPNGTNRGSGSKMVKRKARVGLASRMSQNREDTRISYPENKPQSKTNMERNIRSIRKRGRIQKIQYVLPNGCHRTRADNEPSTCDKNQSTQSIANFESELSHESKENNKKIVSQVSSPVVCLNRLEFPESFSEKWQRRMSLPLSYGNQRRPSLLSVERTWSQRRASLPSYKVSQHRMSIPLSEVSHRRMSIPSSEGSRRRTSIHLSEGSQRRGSIPLSEGSQRRASITLSEGSQRRGSIPLSEGSQWRASIPLYEGSQRRASIPLSDGSQRRVSITLSEGSQRRASITLSEGSQRRGSQSSSDSSQYRTSHPSSEGSEYIPSHIIVTANKSLHATRSARNYNIGKRKYGNLKSYNPLVREPICLKRLRLSDSDWNLEGGEISERRSSDTSQTETSYDSDAPITDDLLMEQKGREVGQINTYQERDTSLKISSSTVHRQHSTNEHRYFKRLRPSEGDCNFTRDKLDVQKSSDSNLLEASHQVNENNTLPRTKLAGNPVRTNANEPRSLKRLRPSADDWNLGRNKLNVLRNSDSNRSNTNPECNSGKPVDKADISGGVKNKKQYNLVKRSVQRQSIKNNNLLQNTDSSPYVSLERLSISSRSHLLSEGHSSTIKRQLLHHPGNTVTMSPERNRRNLKLNSVPSSQQLPEGKISEIARHLRYQGIFRIAEDRLILDSKTERKIQSSKTDRRIYKPKVKHKAVKFSKHRPVNKNLVKNRKVAR